MSLFHPNCNTQRLCLRAAARESCAPAALHVHVACDGLVWVVLHQPPSQGQTLHLQFVMCSLDMDVERACANNTSELPETPGVAQIFAQFEAGYTARTGGTMRRITPGELSLFRPGWPGGAFHSIQPRWLDWGGALSSAGTQLQVCWALMPPHLLWVGAARACLPNFCARACLPNLCACLPTRSHPPLALAPQAPSPLSRPPPRPAQPAPPLPTHQWNSFPLRPPSPPPSLLPSALLPAAAAQLSHWWSRLPACRRPPLAGPECSECSGTS